MSVRPPLPRLISAWLVAGCLAAIAHTAWASPRIEEVEDALAHDREYKVRVDAALVLGRRDVAVGPQLREDEVAHVAAQGGAGVVGLIAHRLDLERELTARARPDRGRARHGRGRRLVDVGAQRGQGLLGAAPHEL